MSDQAGLRPFRVGLTMAGAVSAGAYTAGVVDFLLEALEAWSAEKRRLQDAGVPRADWPIPPHEVMIEAMSGTSAGAMTTALAAVAFCSETKPVRRLPEAGEDSGNLLYESWVRRIDIGRLLTLEDLRDAKAPVRSLLDGTCLSAIAHEALAYTPRTGCRPYVAPLLPIHLFLTNLRGVPYEVSFAGGDGHDMQLHSDRASFLVCQPGADPHRHPANGQGWLLPADDPADEAWPHLADAALASGAFPIGLPARVVRSLPAFYEARCWARLAACEAAGEDSDCLRIEEVPVAPVWHRNGPPPPGWREGRIKFANADGGFLNNEPFEIVRRELSGGAGRRNAREGAEADAAVIMIDPFPTPCAFKPEPWDGDGEAEPPTDVLTVLGQLIGAAKNDGRFKAEAVVLTGQTFSRFMIAPAAAPVQRPDGIKDETLTSGAAAAFGGFLSEAFRRHDFQLGRRNCQRFLQRHFVLHKENPVFPRDWVERRAADWALPLGGEGPAEYLPILPLMKEAPDPDWPGERYDLNSEVELPPRPTLDREQLRDLRHRFDLRLGALLPRLVASLPVTGMTAWLLRNGINMVLKGRLVESIAAWVVEDLECHRVLGADVDRRDWQPPRPPEPDR